MVLPQSGHRTGGQNGPQQDDSETDHEEEREEYQETRGIEPSCCACETQAYRIGVVVDLIRPITDRRAEEDIDDGGWCLTTVADLLEDGQKELRTSAGIGGRSRSRRAIREPLKSRAPGRRSAMKND